MSSFYTACLLFAATGQLDVTVQTLRGTATDGELRELSDKSVVIESAAGPEKFETTDLMAVRARWLFEHGEPSLGPESSVSLVDDSQLQAAAFGVEGSDAVIQLAGGDAIELPTRAIRAVRFQRQSPTVREQWQQILDGKHSADVIVIRKLAGDPRSDGEQVEVRLDYLEGTLGDIDDTTVRFTYEGTEISAPRQKVEGVVYYHPPSASLPDAVCQLQDTAGNTWNVRSVGLTAEAIQLVTVAGVKHRILLPEFSAADFSTGNLQFLTDLEPERVDWRPYLQSTVTPETVARWFQPKWDTGLYGHPLMLGGLSYERGLALHSRTQISFRLTGEYRRFLATVGVDDRFRSVGNVRLVVSTENGTLVDRLVSGKDDPFDLDLDIQNARRLQILVDFGDDRSDSGDHLNLCNARLTK
jgi:hypothetical protein